MKKIQEELNSSSVLSRLAWILGFLATIVQLFSAAYDESFVPKWLGIVSLISLAGFLSYLVYSLSRVYLRYFEEQGHAQEKITKIERYVDRQIAAEVITDTLSQGEFVYQYLAKRYGFGYRSLRIECIIQQNGNATITRFTEAEAFGEVSDVDTTIFIDESDTDTNGAIDVISIKSVTPGRDVSYQVKKNENAISAMIQFAPPLQDGEIAAFEFKEELPDNLYATSPDEITQRRTTNNSIRDFFGWTISQPTRKLRLTVYFPDSVKPVRYKGEVRYAPTGPGLPDDRIQHNEQKLVKVECENPVPNRNVLKLNVEYPITGLVYVLSWQITDN